MPVVIKAPNVRTKGKKFVLRVKSAGGTALYRQMKKKNLAKSVKKIIDNDKELKSAGVYSGVQNYNAAASVAGDIVRTIPTIAIGDGDDNRDGRLIKMKKHVIKGCVAVTGNTAHPDMYVDVWSVEDKYQQNFLQADAATAFLVLLNGQMVPTNPGGLPLWQEIAFRLNRDRFIIRRKRIKLGWNFNPASTLTTLTDPTVSAMRTFELTRTWKRGRVLRYQTDADTIPSNYNHYCFFSIGAYDETYYGTLSTVGIKASISSTLYFTDK